MFNIGQMNAKMNPRYDIKSEKAFQLAISSQQPQPTILEIHPSPSCQLKCPYCHSVSVAIDKATLSRNESLLSQDEYSRLFDEFLTIGGSDLVVSGGGEPLTNQQIVSLLNISWRKGLLNHLYTNGISALHFSPTVLGKWLPTVASIRFSIHQSLGKQNTSLILNHMRNTVLMREKLGLNTRVNVAILVDTYPKIELVQMLESIVQEPMDCIELRTIIPPKPRSLKLLNDAFNQLVSLQFSSSRIHMRAPIKNMPIVPRHCFALYRSITVDPSGGFRFCCMRAHYGQDDVAYIGSLRKITLTTALRYGYAKMAFLGQVTCQICSFRDSYFSEIIQAQLNMRNL